MPELVIAPLASSDADLLPGLNRQFIAPEVFEGLIVSCPRYPAYVRALLAVPPGVAESLFVGARRGGALVGYAEWRRLSGAFFLNMIAVSEADRGGGTGRLLLRAGLNHARQLGLERVDLDVFDWNVRARGWYERLGLRPVSRTVWLMTREKNQGRPGTAIVHELPQADAAHAVFGFSSFRVSTEQGSHVVGRLHGGLFRLSSPAALDDGALLHALYELDPTRGILAIVPEETPVPSGFVRITASARLTVRTSELDRRLGDDR